MGKFIVTTRGNGEFQFNLQAGNGQTILSSEGYSSKAACMNGIGSVKTNSQEDSKFEKLVASNGKPYFVLKAGNGQIIGTSQIYADESGRDNGIESVKSNAKDAEVVEQ